MKCKNCGASLKVHRSCRRIRMRCTGCSREFFIHEVADQLDPQTEAILERYNTIIYD